MSWLNESLSPNILSHLTGQIKNFTQEVLSDGIINEIGDRSKDLEKVNEECNQLQELLNSKDAIISVLRKENSDLQKVIESLARSKDSINSTVQVEDESEGALLCDPVPRSRNQTIEQETNLPQEQFNQTTMKMHDFELEINCSQKLSSSNIKDDENFKEPSLNTEALRAKQDRMNSVIQMDEKLSIFEAENEQSCSNGQDNKANFKKQGKLYFSRDETQINEVQHLENRLHLRIKELEAENCNLLSNIEELDKQHIESIERILSIKEEIKKKHQSLQNAYEHLYVEHNQALSTIENLHSQQEQQQQQQQQIIESNKPSFKETLDSTVQTISPLKVDKETKVYLSFEDKQTEMDFEVDEKLDLETEIKTVNNILKDISFEISIDNNKDSLLISLAQQFVNLKLKEEKLERKLTEQNSDLKQNLELRNSLQNDCENMQSKIMTLHREIEDSKILRSKLIKSEERIFSLEKQLESLQKDTYSLSQSNSNIYNESISNATLLKAKTSLEDKWIQANLNDKKGLSFPINFLKSQLIESSEILSIMENIKLKIECTNNEINKFPLEPKLNTISEENADSNINEINETKNLLLTLMNLHKNIDKSIVKQKHFDSICQELITEIERNEENVMFNENDYGINKIFKYSDNHILDLENENQILKKKVLQVDYLEKENENLKEQIEKFYDQQKLQEDENNLQKELTIKYQTEYVKFKTLEAENQKLKVELDKLAVEKCNAEMNTDDSIIENKNSFNDCLFNKEYSQLMAQLSEKSNEIEILKMTIVRDKEAALMAKETVENLSKLISSKDNEIVKMNHSYDLLKNDRNELIKLVQEKHNESLQYHLEIQRLTQLLHEQTTNLQKLIAEKDGNLAKLQEKESQLLWTQNELQVIKQRLQNIEETNNYEERCGIAEHSLLSNQISSLEDKNKIMEAAILQDQSNIRYLQEQLTDSQSKEAIALKEVDRLRNHLVEIEKNYTEEALQSEEIQRTLEVKLMQVEEKLKNSSTLYTSASIRANQQVETLQQQLALIVQQRDDLQNKISTTEDKVFSYTASLTNLQLVLEQFQKNKEKDIQIATEKLRIQLQESFQRQDDLTNEITDLRDQLTEAKEGLLAASRLTEQLKRKSERIEQLNQEVNRLIELVSTADERIEQANKCNEGKVDRYLVKNLLLGYLSSPFNDKISVLRVFANVLDFNETERENCGLNSSAVKNSWFSSVINSSSTSSKEQEASLSSAFIKFLESESQPKPQLPALPISNLSINSPDHSRQHSSSTQSTLLLSNVTLPTFPDFVPARNTGSILKEVLKDS